MNQTDIAKELLVDRNTVMRDIKELNQWTRKGLYSLAKEGVSTMLYSCIIGINETEKEAWKIYNNEQNNRFKIIGLRLARFACYLRSINPSLRCLAMGPHLWN